MKLIEKARIGSVVTACWQKLDGSFEVDVYSLENIPIRKQAKIETDNLAIAQTVISAIAKNPVWV